MPRKPKEKKPFYIKGKDVIVDNDAPVISDEFIDKTREEGDYHGQTIEVKSDTKLEEDTGTGKAVIMRAFEFGANPEMFKNGFDIQEVFNSHSRGILSMLWADGLAPLEHINPRIIFSKDKKKYIIMITAEPRMGQVVAEKPRTLGEIAKEIHDSKSNTDKVR